MDITAQIHKLLRGNKVPPIEPSTDGPLTVKPGTAEPQTVEPSTDEPSTMNSQPTTHNPQLTTDNPAGQSPLGSATTVPPPTAEQITAVTQTVEPTTDNQQLTTHNSQPIQPTTDTPPPTTDNLQPVPYVELEKTLSSLPRENLETQTKEVIHELQQRLVSERAEQDASNETKKALINILEDARELEAQVKTERDRLQTIIASVGEGLVVIDKDYRVVMMNPVAEKLLETSFAEAQNKRWDDITKIFVNDKELAFDERPIKQVFTTGKTVNATIDDNFFYQSKTGKKFPISLSNAPLLSSEGVIGAVSVFRDITHEKEEKSIIEKTVEQRTHEIRGKNEALEKAQIEISQGWLQAQREKARLTASINSLPIGFILTDKDNAIFMVNSAAKRILSIATDIYHTDVLQQYLGNACKLSDLLTQTQDTKSIIRQNDMLLGAKYVNLMVVPILLDVGSEFLGSAIVVEDITERKIIDRSRDEFFSIASHELRTPLTAIRGNTSMIKTYYLDKIKDQKELVEMIEDIHSSSVRLIQIVNDFLTVSRLEMKKLDFKKEVFDLKELLSKSNKEAEATAMEKKISMVLNIPEDLPKTFADQNRTKEVLLNLMGNAIKYTEHGSVTTDVTHNNGFITIAVSDSGIGIPRERWDLLFRKFQQAAENILTRDTSRSTGMGLYISKLMVEGMGGKIWLERSEPGKGSTFSFTLPVATDAIVAAAAKQAAPTASAPILMNREATPGVVTPTVAPVTVEPTTNNSQPITNSPPPTTTQTAMPPTVAPTTVATPAAEPQTVPTVPVAPPITNNPPPTTTPAPVTVAPVTVQPSTVVPVTAVPPTVAPPTAEPVTVQPPTASLTQPTTPSTVVPTPTTETAPPAPIATPPVEPTIAPPPTVEPVTAAPAPTPTAPPLTVSPTQQTEPQTVAPQTVTPPTTTQTVAPPTVAPVTVPPLTDNSQPTTNNPSLAATQTAAPATVPPVTV